MKYSTYQIRQMSWATWNETMAKELNVAGFKTRGFNTGLGKWENNIAPYKADPSKPQTFILGIVAGESEIKYLKEIGLLNNERCPMCGEIIHVAPERFYFYNEYFHICQNCANKGRVSLINTAQNRGCLITLLCFPYHLIKVFLM